MKHQYSLEALDECSSWRICSKHFQSGRPAHFRQVNDPDWVPSIDVDKVRTVDNSEVIKNSPKSSVSNRSVIIHSAVKKRKLFHKGDSDMSDIVTYDNIHVEERKVMKEVCTQTDMSSADIQRMVDEVRSSTLTQNEFEAEMKASTRKLTYYCGLSKLALFKLVLHHIDDYLSTIRIRKLSNFQKLLIVFMKLRLNVDYTDLGYRFHVRTSTISSLFKKVIICLEHTFRDFIHWPDRASLEAMMPSPFKLLFGNRVSVIIDCFEIKIEKPSMLNAKAATFSNYNKGANTAKYLLGITPVGSISFLSPAYGGRVSDQCITQKCGVLDKLAVGDILLADRGFTVSELVAATGARLVTPDFRKRNEKQLSPFAVENTQSIASVRIHVERVIRSIRNKYKITKGPLPISMLRETYENVALIDYILRVCCVLVNLCDSIVDST